MATARATIMVDAKGNFSDLESKIKALGQSFEKLRLPRTASNDMIKSYDQILKDFESARKHMEKGFKTPADVANFQGELTRITTSLERIGDLTKNANFSSFRLMTSDLAEVNKQMLEATASLEKLKSQSSNQLQVNCKIKGEEKVVSLEEALKRVNNVKYKDLVESFRQAYKASDFDKMKESADSLTESLEKSSSEEYKSIAAGIKSMMDSIDEKKFKGLSSEITQTERVIKDLNQRLKEGGEVSKQELVAAFDKIIKSSGEVRESLVETAKAEQETNSSMDELKNKIQYFFGIAGAARIARQAVRELWQSTKELDEAMTETAVVTDFSVGDMWDKLPQYTANAKALGVATREMYDATTLYYQQGLKGNDVMNIGVETLKLARIAGLEAAQSTDLMTTALRGFNMEINETSARRVSDTYAALAANSASNVQELATAMSKTASIAASVGAEFENIAVFLAQGIETTRESADNIGTAMKTVLARFNEMKKDPAEIMDVEGEEVNVNRVEEALHSAGIELRDVNGQFREADKVLLEVAEKWNTLTLMQQRYIATQAAGSRQQSRFIAMMSDYNRTLELQNIAYNSTGAAEGQFEKTQDSLQTKVARLKDTTQEFILGLANQSVVKGLVDSLTTLLNVINKLSSASGLLGSVIKALLAAATFKGAKNIFVSLFAGKEAMKEAARLGENASKAFKDAFVKNMKGQSLLKTLFGEKGPSGDKELLKEVSSLPQKAIGAKRVKEIQDKWLGASKKKQKTAKWALEEIEKNGVSVDNIKKANGESLSSKEKDAVKTLQQYNEVTKQAENVTNAHKEAISGIDEAYTNYFKSVGLADDQLQQAMLMTEAGASADDAAALAKSGVTAAELEKSAATAAGIPVEEAEGKVTQDMIRKEAQKQALEQKGIVGKYQALALKLRDIVVTKLQKIETDKHTSAIMRKVAAYIAEKAAALGVLGTTIALTIAIAAAVAAIAGLVIGIKAIAKAAKASSLEGQMEANKKAIDEAADSANKAKEAYDELLTGKDKYTELHKGLEEAKKGTDEWRQKLVETNAQVLELIDKFPALSEFLGTGKNGELTISSEGFSKVIQQQFENTLRTQEVLLGNQLQGVELRREAARKDFSNVVQNYGGTGIYGMNPDGTGGVNVTSYQASDIFEKFGLKKGIERLQGLGVTEENAKAIADGYQKYEEAIAPLAAEAENYRQALVNSYQSHLESLGATAEESEGLANVYAQANTTAQEVIERSAELRDGVGANSGAANRLRELGYSEVDISSNQKQNLAKLYTHYTGKTTQDLLDYFGVQSLSKVSAKEIANLVAQYDLAGTASENLQKFYQNYFSTLNKTQKEFFNNLLEKDGKDLLPKDLGGDKSAEDVATSYLEDYAKKMGVKLDSDEAKQAFAESLNFEDWDELLDHIKDNIESAKESYKSAQERLEEYGNVNEAYEGIVNKYNLTSGQANSLSSHLYDIILGNDEGKSLAENFLNNSLTPILNSLSASERGTFLDAIGDLDWTDEDAINDLKKNLKELGVNIPDKKLNALTNQIKKLSNAASSITLDKFNEQLSKTRSLVAGLKERDYNKFNFTEEEKNALVSAGIDKDAFVQIGDEYVYLGDSINELIVALNNNTSALKGQLIEKLKHDIDQGNYVGNQGITVNESGKLIGIGDASTKSQVKWLKDLSDAGADIGISSQVLNEWLNQDKFNAEEMQKIDDKVEEFLNYYKEKDKNAEQLREAKTTNTQDYVDGPISKTKEDAMADSSENSAATKALIARARAASGLEKEITNLRKAQDKYNKTQDATTEKALKEAKASLADAVAKKELQNSINTLYDKTKDYLEILESGDSSTEDYGKALSEVTAAAKNYLGIDLSNVFDADPSKIQEFIAAIKDGPEAVADFIDSLNNVDLYGFTTNFDEVKKILADAGVDVVNNGNIIKSVCSMLDGLKFGIEGEADFTQIFQALYSLTGSVQAAYAMLEQLAGTSVTFTPEYGSTPLIEIPEDASRFVSTLGGILNTTNKALGAAGIAMGGQGSKSYNTNYLKTLRGSINRGGSSSSTGYSPSGGGSNGGDSGGGDDGYKADFDKYFNWLKKIEAVTHDIAGIDHEIGELNRDEIKDISKLVSLNEKKKSLLESELATRKDLLRVREEDLKKMLADFKKEYGGYAYFTDMNLGVDINDPNFRNVVQQNYEALMGLEGSDSEWAEELVDKMEKMIDLYDAINSEKEELNSRTSDYNDLMLDGISSLDKQYELVQKIAKAERDYSLAEIEGNRLLQKRKVLSEEIHKNILEQLKDTEAVVKLNEDLLKKRKQEMDEFVKTAKASGWDRYFNFSKQDNGSYIIGRTAEYFKLNSEEMSEADNFVSQFEDLNSNITDAEDAINEGVDRITSTIKTLREATRDSYDRIRQAIITDRQRVIDAMSAIDETIQKADSDILDSIQTNLERRRQDEANQKAEENITDKEARLAYLMQDTSGANLLEIQKLQKEIEDDKKSYTDTLIDQKISELQQQNEEASKQRQEQIDIAQKQLDFWVATGGINTEVERLISTGLDSTGKLIRDSELYKVLYESEDLMALTELEKDIIISDINALFGQMVAYFKYLTVGGPESAYKVGQDISSQTPNASTKITDGGYTMTWGEKPNQFTAAVTGVHENANGEIYGGDAKFYKSFTAGDARKALRIAAQLDTASDEQMRWYDLNGDKKITANEARHILRQAAKLEFGNELTERNFASDEINTLDIVKGMILDSTTEINDYIRSLGYEPPGATSMLEATSFLFRLLGKKKNPAIPAYASGGLANYTGLAWLDGTPSNPELILNQKDTQNFIQLKDILSDILRSSRASGSGINGDTYFEIHIEVDKLESDYDVDNVADRVKQIIYNDSMYRNVNFIQGLR